MKRTRYKKNHSKPVAMLLIIITTVTSLTMSIYRYYRTYQILGHVGSNAASVVKGEANIKDILNDDFGGSESEKDATNSTYYEYTSDDGQKKTKTSPVYYTNGIVGQSMTKDIGYDSSFRITFTPQYVNGYLFPDGTQQEVDSSNLYAYQDSSTGEYWYSQKPYTYYGVTPGKTIERTPGDNPRNVKIRFTPQYNTGCIYPDGHQENIY